MSRVVIYITATCPYCTAAKGLLNRKKIPFREINIDNDPAKRKWLSEVTGLKTVPQIFIDDHPIGGYQELVALDQSSQLDNL